MNSIRNARAISQPSAIEKRGMADHELTTMAMFRMREVAKRLRLLAQHAESPALVQRLTNCARQIEDQARRLPVIITDVDEGREIVRGAVGL